MRADRLVAAPLFLQTRQRVTAAELAAELDVSERAARRDLEALASAGVPVHSQAGKGGGWALVGGARTDLTGLTAPEIAATVRGRAAPGTEPPLEGLLGARIRYGEAAPDGWTPVEIDGPCPEAVAARLAGLGARVELLDPREARTALARIGGELTALHGQRNPALTPAPAPAPVTDTPEAPPRAPVPAATRPG